jgi:hypothetical protein
MNLVATLLNWLFQLPPLQAMRWGARNLLEFTLLALVDPETLAPRDLDEDYLRFLHRGVSTAADLIDMVVGVRAAELAGAAGRRGGRRLPELPRKRCDRAALIRRVCDLLHRLDHAEAAAMRLVRRIKAALAETARIGRIAGLPADAPASLHSRLALECLRASACRRALELSG